ncbi:MAG: hypothetical protein M0Q38_02730 [Bacteroidales bacterium]|nr:hypothetical protein [Bacteroidales bacterium]
MKKLLISLIVFLGLIQTSFGQQKTSRTDTIKNKQEGVVVITTTVNLPGISNSSQNKTSDTIQSHSVLLLPVVESIVSLRPKRHNNNVVIGDYIIMKIDNHKRFNALRDSLERVATVDSSGLVILYINGIPIRDILCINENPETKEFVFFLDRNSKELHRFYPFFTTMFSGVYLKLSLGFPNGPSLPNIKDYKGTHMKYVSVGALISALMMIVIVLGIVFFLSRKTDLIRVGDNQSQFSLGLAQLIFWTVIIASSYFYLWIISKTPGSLTDSTLILLGISITTTAGSKLVDFRRKTPVPVHVPSRGFWVDMASDSVGYSVHRCQMILWTIILGIIFVQKVIAEQQIPAFDETLLALMGISSAGFVGLKTMENTVKEGEGPDSKKGI